MTREILREVPEYGGRGACANPGCQQLQRHTAETRMHLPVSWSERREVSKRAKLPRFLLSQLTE